MPPINSSVLLKIKPIGMNFINRFFLYLLLLPSAFYEKMGVNLTHLKAILSVKLMMDDRRPNSIQQTRIKKEGKPVKWATLGTMLLSAFMGAFFLVSFMVGHDYVTQFSIYFAFYIFILASTLISDFTSVLLDIRDNMIILPKPVNDRTFVLARLLHIITHISKIVLPMTIPGMIFIGINMGGLAILPFILMVTAASMFTIFLINALYLVILKVTTPEKFKNIISYFQIFFAIFFYASYQLVPRLLKQAYFENLDISKAIWAWLFPPYWFAGGWAFLYNLDFSLPLTFSFLLSILTPWISIWVVIKYFAPSFNRKLAMISGGSEASPSTVHKATTTVKTASYAEKIAGLLTRKGPERMAFLHTWKITARSRDFKLKVYPSFGYMIVFLVVIFAGKRISLASIREHADAAKGIFLTLVYFCSFILMIAIQQLSYSDQYKASWIYYTTPIKTPGALISGAVKAAIAKFYLPLVLVTAIVSILFFGLSILPNLFLGTCNMLTITALIAYITLRELPFSQTQSISARSGNFLKGIFTIIIPGMLAFLHYMVYSNTIVVIILCILSGIACWLVIDAIGVKDWKQIRTQVSE